MMRIVLSPRICIESNLLKTPLIVEIIIKKISYRNNITDYLFNVDKMSSKFASELNIERPALRSSRSRRAIYIGSAGRGFHGFMDLWISCVLQNLVFIFYYV